MSHPGRFLAAGVAAAVLCLGFWTRSRLATSRGAGASSRAELPFLLTETASASGLAYTPGRFEPHPALANLAPRLGSLGVSVAVVDYDGDGWPDVFVSDPARGGKNRQFRNDHDGTFTDRAAGPWPIKISRR